MAVNAIGTYEFEPRDRVENFHGNILLYFHWDRHLMFAAPITLPVEPDTQFSALIENVLPELYGRHPDFAQINWDEVIWTIDDKVVTPQRDASLRDNGIGHKSTVYFATPALSGLYDAHF